MSKGGKFVFGAGVLTGIGLLIAHASKASAAPPPGSGKGSINITVYPANATLTLDGQAINSGITSGLTVRAYTLVASATGYVAQTIQVNVLDGQTANVPITLVAVTPTTGTVNISITPVGYLLLIDGSPVTANQVTLTAGSHPWQASLNGYVTQSGNLAVVAGHAIPLTVALVPVTATQGTVTISVTPANATVIIGGVLYTTTPIQLPAGTYPWTVSANGYTTQNGNLIVAAGQTTPLSVNLVIITPPPTQYGEVAFVGHPITTTFNVDGATYQPGFAQFAVGTYNYVASAPGYDSQSGQFTVQQGLTTTVAVTLNPSGPPPTQYGMIVFTPTPINAQINIEGAIYQSGSFQFGTGTFNYTVSAPGYVDQTGTLTVLVGQTTTVNPTLTHILALRHSGLMSRPRDTLPAICWLDMWGSL